MDEAAIRGRIIHAVQMAEAGLTDPAVPGSMVMDHLLAEIQQLANDVREDEKEQVMSKKDKDEKTTDETRIKVGRGERVVLDSAAGRMTVEENHGQVAGTWRGGMHQ